MMRRKLPGVGGGRHGWSGSKWHGGRGEGSLRRGVGVQLVGGGRRGSKGGDGGWVLVGVDLTARCWAGDGWRVPCVGGPASSSEFHSTRGMKRLFLREAGGGGKLRGGRQQVK